MRLARELWATEAQMTTTRRSLCVAKSNATAVKMKERMIDSEERVPQSTSNTS